MFNTKIYQALSGTVSCNAARLKCFCLIVNAIIRHRTVNLTILATTADGKSCLTQSRYRRFQDFFLKFSLCLTTVSKVILARIPKPAGGYILAMDRTNWQFGRRHINFLVIAIVVGNVSIPIAWTILPKKTKSGNSNAYQRKQLTKKLLAVLPATEITVLTMDREFIGKQWLEWLNEQDVAYIVRIKKNVWVGKNQAGKLARRPGPQRKERLVIFGLELFFASKSMKGKGRDESLMVISNCFSGKEALKIYRQRWGIERLFGHLKRNGFDLEATHMTDARKLERLFALTVLAFLFSFAWGCRLRENSEKMTAAAKRKSIFRLGLEDILTLLAQNPKDPSIEFHQNEFWQWLQSETFESIFLV
ncbi:IS4 family transposase (plasmid) [Verrucomicrobiaceae bacterium 227]